MGIISTGYGHGSSSGGGRAGVRDQSAASNGAGVAGKAIFASSTEGTLASSTGGGRPDYRRTAVRRSVAVSAATAPTAV